MYSHDKPHLVKYSFIFKQYPHFYFSKVWVSESFLLHFFIKYEFSDKGQNISLIKILVKVNWHSDSPWRSNPPPHLARWAGLKRHWEAFAKVLDPGLIIFSVNNNNQGLRWDRFTWKWYLFSMPDWSTRFEFFYKVSKSFIYWSPLIYQELFQSLKYKQTVTL